VAIFLTLIPSVIIPLKASYTEESKLKEIGAIDLTNLREIIKNDIGFKSFLDFLTTEFSTENLLCWRELSEWLAASKQVLKSDLISSGEKTTLVQNPSNSQNSSPVLSKVQLYCRAQEIWRNYIDEKDAPYMVNVSSALREQTHLALETLGTKLTSFSSTTIFSETPENSTRDLLAGTPSNVCLLRSSETDSSPHDDTSFEALHQAYEAVEVALYDLMNSDSFQRYKLSEFFVQLGSKGSHSKNRPSLGPPTVSKLPSASSVDVDLSIHNGPVEVVSPGEVQLTTQSQFEEA